jgi:hypothetical protein
MVAVLKGPQHQNTKNTKVDIFLCPKYPKNTRRPSNSKQSKVSTRIGQASRIFIVFFLSGDSLAYEFYAPTFRNTLCPTSIFKGGLTVF